MSDKSAATNPAVLEESLCDISKSYRLRFETTNMMIADELGLIAGDGSLLRPFCCFFNRFDGTLVAIRIKNDEIVIFNKNRMHKRVQERMIEHDLGREY